MKRLKELVVENIILLAQLRSGLMNADSLGLVRPIC
jgi:hypothetical protein